MKKKSFGNQNKLRNFAVKLNMIEENEQIAAPKPRLEWIDLAKGICMMLVVWSHTYLLFQNEHLVAKDFYNQMGFFFRMPLYFLLSGLFFKTYASPLMFLKKKVNNLLIPYLTFWLILAITPLKFSTIWFLGCLFWLSLIFYVLQWAARGEKWVVYVASVVLGLIGYHYQIGPQWTHWGTAFTAMPFFCLGYYLRNSTTFLESKSNVVRDTVIAILLFFVLYLIVKRNGRGTISYILNAYSVQFLAMYVGGAIGVFGVLLTARLVKRLPIVSYIGRYSIIVLVFHFPVLSLIPKTFLHTMWFSAGWWAVVGLYLLSLLISLPAIYIGRHYLPYITAQKNVFDPEFRQKVLSIVTFIRKNGIGIILGMVRWMVGKLKAMWQNVCSLFMGYVKDTMKDE